jgi:alpha-L-rhamnosidase
MKGFWIVAAFMLGTIATVAGAEAIKPTNLRCEYKENPLGLEVTQPRLTWTLDSAWGGTQSAYQILVASSPDKLEADEADRWDSGKVASAETVLIAYDGAPLESRDACHWKVRVWNAEGEPSDWSPPAHWTMGLLSPGDWQAKWIGYDAPASATPEAEPGTDLSGANWIWYADGNPAESARPGKVFFRRQFDVEDKPVANATLYITADNRCHAHLNGIDLYAITGAMEAFNMLFSAEVTDLLQKGDNLLAIEAENAGKAENPAGMIAKLVMTYADGSTDTIASDDSWKAIRRGRKDWQLPAHDDSDWPDAMIAAKVGEGPWQTPAPRPPLELPPPPYLRKAFSTEKEIASATLYTSALGLYETYFNGERVGEDYFTPGWTDYFKRVYYQTYDVTDLIDQGDNAWGTILADGWYAGYIGFRRLNNLDKPRNYYEGEPRYLGQLEITYTDGSKETIITDDSWRASYGEIREADLLMGERRDTRRAQSGWTQPDFDDADWAAPVTQDKVDIPVQAHPGEPVKIHEEITAVSVEELRPGVYVYDLGQNMVGWVRLQVRGNAGDEVTVRHAEMLAEDGSLYLAALRQARAMDSYVLEGGDQTLEPAFTFHGFRYVEVSGLDYALDLDDVTGVVLHSPIPQTGFFECSEPLLNQLHHNIVWGQKGNYLEVPTDCPQRDERLGWTGDAQFFMPTALYTADIGAFFTKWLVDLVQDSQFPEGYFADIAPNIGLGGGAVAWGDAAVICTYLQYQYYDDERIIEAHYDNLVKHLDWLEETSENHIRSRLGYGDWVNLGGGAKDQVICTSYYYYLVTLMAEMAEVIGREDDAVKYGTLAPKIRDAFIDNFVQDDGSILDSSQTGYALAFTMDLIPEDLKEKAADRFVEEIDRFDGHLATGFIGTPRLLPGLSKAGRLDTAYDLLMKKTFPSWLFQVTLGATTMWERWDGWTPDQGFQTPSMNSFNHYAFGAVGEFLYKYVGGIRRAAPGFREILIAPEPGGGLTWANVTYDSIRGKITSSWTHEGELFELTVMIPPNVKATVVVPGQRVDLSQQPGIEVVEQSTNQTTYRIGGGAYTFTSMLK